MNNLLSKTPKLAAVLCLSAFGLTALCFSACASGSVNVPDELSPAEIIQRAQEASDRNRYNVSLQYYQVLLERNRSNIDLIITAEYEIAFIHYKQKKYNQAREELNSLLDHYEGPNANSLPPEYMLLAQKVLERISEKENPLSKGKQRRAS
jgi:outer membrane protein assembly factor BamD (BamD/ComL family)